MFGNGFPDDWSALKRLIWRKLMLGSGSSSVIKTVKGALIHITDALAKPAHELVAVLKPVQDLHGYDSPWPAGGGVNLLDPDATADNMKLTADGGLKAANGWCVSDWIPATENTNYFANNAIPSASGYSMCFYDANKSFLRYMATYGGGDTIRDSGADAAYLRVTVNLSKKAESIVAQSSASIPFAPYSNECPISGWDGCMIEHTGWNVFDESNANYVNGYVINPQGGIDANVNYKYSDTYFPMAEIPYMISVIKTVTTLGLSAAFYDGSKNFIRRDVLISAANTGSPISAIFTPPTDTKYFRITCGNVGITNIQINPYRTLPLLWHGSGADPDRGVIYGGYVQLNEDGSGSVTKAWAYYKTNSWTANGKNTAGLNVYYSTNYVSESLCAKKQSGTAVSNVTNDFGYTGNQDHLRVQLPIAANARFHVIAPETFDIKDLEVAYELASPVTYHFDNIGQLLLFAGENNIWVDASDDLTLTYYADGNVSDEEALNTLLGGMYSPGGDVSDREALNILLGN